LAKRCEICGKTITFGIQLSHSHIRTKRTWSPNLQRVKALIDGRTKRIRVCTQCLRSGKVQRAT
jgi:large subunit ribosomal protein L28